jgi:hypothetical protein
MTVRSTTPGWHVTQGLLQCQLQDLEAFRWCLQLPHSMRELKLFLCTRNEAKTHQEGNNAVEVRLPYRIDGGRRLLLGLAEWPPSIWTRP